MRSAGVKARPRANPLETGVLRVVAGASAMVRCRPTGGTKSMDQDGHRGAKARAKLGAAAFLSLLALSLLPAGCGGSPENRSGDRDLAANSATADAEWEWLQTTRRELDEKRQRLA